MGDDPASDRWRREFLYSRAATIYGGTAEIQRNIIARRLLDLGAGPVMDDDERALFEETLRRRLRLLERGGPRPSPSTSSGGPRPCRPTPAGRVLPLRAAGLGTTPPSSALGAVLASASDWTSSPTATTVLPAPGRGHPPGRIDGRHLAVRGLGTASLAGATTAWVVVGSAATRPATVTVAVEVATADLTLRTVAGRRPAPRSGRGDRRPRPAPRSPRRSRRRLAAGGGPGPAGHRPRTGRRLADHARAGPGPRPGADPVRPAHRQLPGRPPPAGRHAWWPSRPPRPARLGLGRGIAGRGGLGQGPGRPKCPDARPGTASRCWPASGSPPSTTSTTTFAGCWCSTSCSGRPGP